MIDFFIGTMGFSYRDWVGVFYPPGLTSRDFLSYYSGVFNAVEIDSTFYGTPKVGSVIRWRDNSPEEFKVCLKIPRSITHEAALVNVNKEMTEFIRAVNPLGEKLGVLLLQFPPSYTIANIKVLNDFLDILNTNFRFAVEFRHPSWYTPQTAEMLAKHDVCWVATEYQGVPKEVELTSDLLFIRLVGKHGRFRAHDRVQTDVSTQLDWWWQWIRAQSERVQSVYIFINDDYSGYAPASANKLKSMIGLTTVEPNLPKQMRLF